MFEKTETPQERRERYLRQADEARALSTHSLPPNARSLALRVADDWLALANEVQMTPRRDDSASAMSSTA